MYFSFMDQYQYNQAMYDLQSAIDNARAQIRNYERKRDDAATNWTSRQRNAGVRHQSWEGYNSHEAKQYDFAIDNEYRRIEDLQMRMNQLVNTPIYDPPESSNSNYESTRPTRRTRPTRSREVSHNELANRAGRKYVSDNFPSAEFVSYEILDQSKRLCRIKFKYAVGIFTRNRTKKITY